MGTLVVKEEASFYCKYFFQKVFMYLAFTNLQLGLKYELNLTFFKSFLIKSQYLVYCTSKLNHFNNLWKQTIVL